MTVPMFPGDWSESLSRLYGARIAIVDERSGARVSYDDLWAKTSSTAGALAELLRGNSTPTPRIAVLAKNRIEHIELMFACARLGCLFVPLNWRLAEAEVAQILDDCTPTVLFHDHHFSAAAHRLCAARSTRAIAVDDPAGWPSLQAAAARLPAPAQVAVSAEEPWIVLYTSGTTGVPKGVLQPHRQVAYNALNTILALDLTQNDKTVTYTPLFHTGGLHVLTTPLLLKGGTVVLADGDRSFDADHLLQLTVTEGCTLLFGVPTTFEMMSSSASFEGADLGHVRLALCGGAPCPLSLIGSYTKRGIVFKQGYGLTEVGPNVLNLNGEDVVRKAGSAGRANAFIIAQVINDQGQVVSAPGRGELCLGGPCVCLGYWDRPDATAAAFTPQGLFKTGDIVEIDADGFMSIVDRKKDMFISGGENVYPAEVEKVLADHPAVRLAAVVGVVDARWGEVGCAFVELRADIAAAELLLFAKSRLAAYKVPKQVIVIDELPKNPSGKVQKHLLPKRVQS